MKTSLLGSKHKIAKRRHGSKKQNVLGGGGEASNENENERLRSEFGRNVSCASNFGQQVFQKKKWTSLYNSTIHCVSSF